MKIPNKYIYLKENFYLVRGKIGIGVESTMDMIFLIKSVDKKQATETALRGLKNHDFWGLKKITKIKEINIIDALNLLKFSRGSDSREYEKILIDLKHPTFRGKTLKELFIVRRYWGEFAEFQELELKKYIKALGG